MIFDVDDIEDKIEYLRNREDELLGMMKSANPTLLNGIIEEHKRVLKSLEYYTNLYFLSNEVQSVDEIKGQISAAESKMLDSKHLCEDVIRENEGIVNDLIERIVRLEQIVSKGKDIKELL